MATRGSTMADESVQLARSLVDQLAASHEDLQRQLKEALQKLEESEARATEATQVVQDTGKQLDLEEAKERAEAEAGYLHKFLLQKKEELALLHDEYKQEKSHHIRYNLLKVHIKEHDITTDAKELEVKKKVHAQAKAMMRDFGTEEDQRLAKRDQKEASVRAAFEEGELADIAKKFAAKRRNGSQVASSSSSGPSSSGIAKKKAPKAAAAPKAASAGGKSAAGAAAAQAAEQRVAALPKGQTGAKRPAPAPKDKDEAEAEAGGEAAPEAAPPPAKKQRLSGRQHFQNSQKGAHQRAKKQAGRKVGFPDLRKWASERWQKMSQKQRDEWQAQADAESLPPRAEVEEGDADDEEAATATEEATEEVAGQEVPEAEAEAEEAEAVERVGEAEENGGEEAAAAAAAGAAAGDAPASDDDDKEEDAEEDAKEREAAAEKELMADSDDDKEEEEEDTEKERQARLDKARADRLALKKAGESIKKAQAAKKAEAEPETTPQAASGLDRPRAAEGDDAESSDDE